MAVDSSDYSTSGAERPFDANRPISLSGSTVTAFIGRTQRGPLNQPIRVGSFEEFRRVFGGHSSFSDLSHTVQHYFQHGGRLAVVVRVANRAIRATLELPAGDQPLRLQAREPGNYCFLRASVDYDGLDSDDQRFNLVVQRVARPGSQLVEDQELFHALSFLEGDKRYFADIVADSAMVQPVRPFPQQRPDATRAMHPGQPIPYVEMSANGSDGEELTDYDVIGSIDESTGLFALSSVEQVDLICIPPEPAGRDFGMTSFVAAERYSEQRHAMLVWDPPSSWTSSDTALIGLRNSGFESQNALIYYPRVRFSERSGRVKDAVPASGVIAALLSQHDREGPWRTFENSDMRLKAGLSPSDNIDERVAKALQRSGMNSFRHCDSGFAEFFGDVTLARSRSVSSLWQRLDRRRLAFFILASVERRVGAYFNSPNVQTSWKDVVLQVGGFLEELFARGALSGASSKQAYVVRAVADPSSGKANVLLRIGFALANAGELQFYDIIPGPSGVESRRARQIEPVRLAV
jgi:hypothetical protein